MSLSVSFIARRDGFRLELEFEIDTGKTAVVVGPNGSGKSTLAAVLTGMLPIESGHIRLDGRLLDDGAHRVPPTDRRVGVMFQDLLLFEHMTARDNAAFGPRCAGATRAEARRIAGHWLDRLGVASKADTKPRALSGGQAQRVALARALAAEPKLLILDEPLSALDGHARPETRRLLADVLADFGGVALVITHDPIEAMALGHRLLILEQGRLVQQGSPEEISRRPRAGYAASLIGRNLFEGVVHHEPDGTRIEAVGGLMLHVPRGDLGDGMAVFASVHPHAVVLSGQQPHTSARNVVRGEIREVNDLGDRRRVLLDTAPPLIAEVTPSATVELNLVPGETVWASFKATEIEVYPR